MTHYDDVKASIGPGPTPPSRSALTSYFGYAKGVALGSFPSKEAAVAAGATTTEKAFDREAYDAAAQAVIAHNVKIMSEWYGRMRADHKDLNDEVFALVYGEAYDRGHSSGLDEVESYVDHFATFVIKVIAANKGA